MDDLNAKFARIGFTLFGQVRRGGLLNFPAVHVIEVVGCVRDSCLDPVLGEGFGDFLRRVKVFDDVECFAIPLGRKQCEIFAANSSSFQLGTCEIQKENVTASYCLSGVQA